MNFPDRVSLVMTEGYRFLHLEECSLSAAVVEKMLRQEWPECSYLLVDSERRFIRALAESDFDAVLADHTLTGYDGVAALAHLLAVAPWIPFIFVTGPLGEDNAVEALKKGATDSILKSNLARLVPSLKRALQEARTAAENRRAAADRERLLSILEASLNEIYIFGGDELLFTYANHSACQNSGYVHEEICALTPLDLKIDLPKEYFLSLLEPLRSGFTNLVVFESLHRRRDGSTYPVEVHLQRVVDSPGTFDSYLEVVSDISERRQAEAEMKKSIVRLELMQEVSQYRAASVQELLDFALDRVVSLSDSRYGYIYHYDESRQEFTLNTWSRGVMAACEVAEPQVVYQLEKTGLWGEVIRQRQPVMVNDYAAPSTLKRGYPEGHVHLSRFLSIPVFDKERIVAVVGVANKETPYDQTDLLQLTLMMEGVWKIVSRLHLEAKIDLAAHQWQGTFDAISDSIALLDFEHMILRCNTGTSRLLDKDSREIIGKPCWQIFHCATEPAADCPMERVKKSRQRETSTFFDEDRWFEVSVDPIFDRNGIMTGAVHVMRDVTRQVNQQNSLQELNELFHVFMQYSPIYAFIKEVSERGSIVLMVSDNFKEMVGISSAEMVGRTMEQIFPQEFAAKITADDQRVIAGKTVLKIEESFNGHSYITYKFPIERSDGRKLLAGYTVNISELKAAEEALRKSRALLAETARIARMGGWEYDLGNGEMNWTEETCRIYEVGSDFTPTLRNTLSFYSPEALPLIREAVNQVIRDHAEFDLELSLITATGKKRLVRTTGHYRRDNEDKEDKGKLYGTFQDVTEERQAAEKMKQIQSQLLQSEKLASIGLLAAGVAHEINNPMTFIYSNMYALQDYVAKYHRYIEAVEASLSSCTGGEIPPGVRELRHALKLDYIMNDVQSLFHDNMEGVERIRNIIQDLKAFSRADTGDMCAVDLNRCLESSINIVTNEIKYNADLKRDYGELPEVICNPQQIGQVFMNLLVNASQAIKEKGGARGEIVIRSRAEGNTVYISVQDSGVGIPEAVQLKIFDPFFTTREVGKGTGLGLSISSEIVHKLGGTIRVKSLPGQGTTFTVELPVNNPVGAR